MSIGYACLTVGVENTDLKSCILKNASEKKLLELIAYNLNSLENIVDYNIKNNILLFRISSDLIPFASSPANKLPWQDIFASQLLKIGKKIQSSGMRVSMHPGQYTVLNSPNTDVVMRAIDDLNYHNNVLDSLGMGPDNKIVLHIGGIYNDKKQAVDRFIVNYNHLDESIKQRLVLENDDKSYNIADVLEISLSINAPVIFDNLHNNINPYDQNKSDSYWIKVCSKTWKQKDGKQKIHYSQQDSLKKPGSHSYSIKINEFMDFYKNLESDIDIMLEVKDKNLSAVKCINCTSIDRNIQSLEAEWSRYKYKVLESFPSAYTEIQKILCNKKDFPAIPFYNALEEALLKECEAGNAINAALHIWGYFKNTVSEKEKNSFLKIIDEYKQGKISAKTIKKSLWNMAVKYQQTYLMNSYYFVL